MRGLIESATYMQSDAFIVNFNLYAKNIFNIYILNFKVCGFRLAYPLNTFVMPEIPKEEEPEVKKDDKKPVKPAKPAKSSRP